MSDREDHWRGNGLPSQGEIARRLVIVENKIDDLDKNQDADRLSETRFRAEILAAIDAVRASMENQHGLLDEIQRARVWMSRTIIAAMIVAVVSGFFTAVIGILNRQILP